MRIAVLGGGNGSFAAAGDFALAGHEVRHWRRDKNAVAAHRAQGGCIVVKDFAGRLDFDQRDAIRDLQAKNGMVPDGHPTPALLQRLGINLQ